MGDDRVKVWNQADMEAFTQRYRAPDSDTDPTNIWWAFSTSRICWWNGTYYAGNQLIADRLQVMVGNKYLKYDKDENLLMNGTGGALIYERESYDWNAQFVCTPERGMILTPFGLNAADLSNQYVGRSCAMHGNHAALGSPEHRYDKNGANSLFLCGTVWTYKRNEAGVWEEHQRLDGTEFPNYVRRLNNNMGMCLAIHGGWLFVGCPDAYDADGNFSLNGTGNIKIYKLDANGDWQAHQQIDDDSTWWSSNRWWPRWLDADGDWLMAGCHADARRWDGGNSASHGGVACLQNMNGTWEIKDRLIPRNNDETYDSHSGMRFGMNVSVLGDVCSVTAPYANYDEDGLNVGTQTGACYIYERAGDQWVFARKFTFPVRKDVERPRHCATIWDDVVIFAAGWHDFDENGENELGNAGGITVCRKVGGTWQTTAECEKLCSYDNGYGNGRGSGDFFGQFVSNDKCGGMHIAVYGADHDKDGNQKNGAGFIYGVGGPALPANFYIEPHVPEDNCLGKLLKVQGAISREVKQNSGEILSGGLDLVFDDSDYHFWQKVSDGDVQNVPVQVHVYMAGITTSRLTVHKGKLSRYSFAEEKFTMSIKDYSYETRTRIVPSRAITASGFMNVSQNFIDHLPQEARPLPLPYGEFSLLGGACPTILYDTSTISYAAAGATIQSIDNVYVGGVTQGSGFTTNIGEQGPDGDVIAWIKFSTFPQGPVTWNGKGIVDDQGGLIDNGVDIIVDIMQRAGGFTDLDFDSGTMQIARQTIDGYKFAGIVGARGFESLSRVMGDLCLSMNARAYFNYANNFSVKILDGATGSGVLDLDAKADFLDGPHISQSFADPVSGFKLATKQQLGYKFNHQYGRAVSVLSVTDQVQSELLGYKTYVTNETIAKWIQDDATATWLIYQLFERSRRPRLLVTGTLFWDAIEAEVGDLVTLTKGIFPDLPTLRYDWNQKDFEVVAVALNIAERSIKMSFLEL
ncbi:MAG: hypothetical protein GY847_01455 [Proteobacteria bacterium]|nr:hypothetical protein [Pseudomonadota bacterium]